MKRIIQTIALLAVFAIMSGTAWSNTYEDHVSQAPGGKGDAMIFPTYLAFDGFQTKLQVINTASDVSAVAKVVVRSPLLSQETLDFFIFLTPTDVWEGYLQWDGSQVILYSENGSQLTSAAPTFASPENPMVEPLEIICDEPNIYGYVEVFLTNVFPDDYVWDGDNINLTSPVVDKTDLYQAWAGAGSPADPQPRTGFLPDEAPINTNILAGNMQIQSPLLNWTSALNAVTFKDYRVSGQENVLSETIWGTFANNNMMEIEAALAKNNIGMPYINNDEGNSIHFFNFPTRITILDECEIVGWFGEYAGFQGHNFDDRTDTWESVRVRYSSTIYDQEEKTVAPDAPIFSPTPRVVNRFLDEVEMLSPAEFDKGWVRYNLDNGPTEHENLSGQELGYYGAPVIPFVLNFGAEGLSTMYGFYTDGMVLGAGGAELPGFQYARSTPGT